jgi:acyl-CoA thioesterase-2
VLYAQEAVSSQRSRGLALGRFYTRGGTLLATVAQEGMIRSGR